MIRAYAAAWFAVLAVPFLHLEGFTFSFLTRIYLSGGGPAIGIAPYALYGIFAGVVGAAVWRPQWIQGSYPRCAVVGGALGAVIGMVMLFVAPMSIISVLLVLDFYQLYRIDVHYLDLWAFFSQPLALFLVVNFSADGVLLAVVSKTLKNRATSAEGKLHAD